MTSEMLLNSFDLTSPDYYPYRLFVAHYMSVDDMGHLHGVTLKYNPYNTYQKVRIAILRPFYLLLIQFDLPC